MWPARAIIHASFAFTKGRLRAVSRLLLKAKKAGAIAEHWAANSGRAARPRSWATAKRETALVSYWTFDARQTGDGVVWLVGLWCICHWHHLDTYIYSSRESSVSKIWLLLWRTCYNVYAQRICEEGTWASRTRSSWKEKCFGFQKSLLCKDKVWRFPWSHV